MQQQEVAAEQVEQQDALEDAGDRVRQAEIDLRRVAAEIGQREQQPGGNGAERVQPPEKGDDDRGEAVARRQRRGQLSQRAGRLQQARRGRPARR
jgi:hypothetical protein